MIFHRHLVQKEEQYLATLNSDKCRADSACGQAFRRAVLATEGEEREKYEAAKQTKGKRGKDMMGALRLSWISQEYDTMKAERLEEEEYEEVDFSTATYESFDSIVRLEGWSPQPVECGGIAAILPLGGQ